MSRTHVGFVVSAALLGTAPMFGQTTPRADRYGDPLPAGAIARLGPKPFHPPDGRHAEEAVTRLAFAPGGKLLASASLDGTVRTWDVASGKEMHRLLGHRRAVVSIAFTPDGQTLASSGDDGTTRLWSVADGRQLVRFQNPPGHVPWPGAAPTVQGGSLAFSSDGKVLVAAGANGMVVAWDVAGKKEVRRLVGETSAVAPVPLPSLNVIVTATGGAGWGDEAPPESLHLWSLSTGQRIGTMLPRKVGHHLRDIDFAALAVSADSSLIGLSQRQRHRVSRVRCRYSHPSLRIWERITGKEVLCIKETVAQALAFSPDGRLLAANDAGPGDEAAMRADTSGPAIALWDPWTGALRALLKGHTGPVANLAFAPDGKTLASGSADRTILIWKVPEFNHAAGNASAAQMQAWWDALARADAAVAHQAGGRLLANAGPAVRLVRGHLKPAVAPDPAAVAAWIADLDSVDFAVRERATAALEALGDLAEPALRQAHAMPPSLEARRRIEALRARAAALTPQRLRNLRALALLERIGDAEARAALAALADGAPAARVTREAQAALGRLGKR